MAKSRKTIQPLNLNKYDVLIEDNGPRSEYFKISQFDGYLYGGRNAFLIAGANVLKPNSTILVEVLNKDGSTVYSAPVASFVEGDSRLIQVEVYSDTPIGVGKLIILGSADKYIDGSPIPDKWKDKYNVRWIVDVTISPLIENKTPLRFEKTPQLFVEEKLYPITSTASFSQSVSLNLGNCEFSPINYNIFQNGYIIKLKNPTTESLFTPDQLGGNVVVNVNYNNSSEVISGELPISKIINNTTIESRGRLLTSSANTKITKLFVSGSGSNYITQIEPIGFVTASTSLVTVVYNKIIESPITASLTSFAKLKISNLNTLSGEVRKVGVYYKSTTEPGDYISLGDVSAQVEELLAIDSASKIINIGQFNAINLPDYWYAASMSLAKGEAFPTIPNYYISSSLYSNIVITQSSDIILNGISATPELSVDNSTYKNNVSYFIGTTNSSSFELFPNSEYTLKFDALASNNSGSVQLTQSDYILEVYLVKPENSGLTSKLLENSTRGQLLGTLAYTRSSGKQLFESVQFNFKPKILNSGLFGLRFVVYGGFWNIANVSLKAAEEQFFSPDELTIIIPNVNFSNKLLTFKTEYLDINNNSTKIFTTSTPVYFTGSALAGSGVGVVASASYAATASYVLTASYALTAGNSVGSISSSYPFAVSGSTIYSTDTIKTNFSTDYAILIGNNAGNNSSGSSWTVFVGEAAGQNTQGSADSVFIGANAADSSTKMYQTVAVGEYAGAFSDDLYNAVAIGLEAGSSTKASPYSVFLGDGAAFAAFSSSYSNIIGATAGFRATSSFSTFIGVNAGGRLSGSNNIILGNSIGLPQNTKNSLNIGGFLFGTGSYFDPNIYDYNVFTGSVGNGRVGINVVQPQHALHVSGSSFVTENSIFGTFQTNVHRFTGSVNINGGITGSLFGTSSRATTSSFAFSASLAQSAASASGISGGSANYIPLWTSATAQSSSNIFQSAGNIGIGTTSPLGKLHVSGTNATRIGLFGGSTRAVRIGADTVAAYVEGVDQTGVGSYQPLYIGGSTLSLLAGGTERWQINSSGHLVAGADVTYDIGTSGATRPRSVYVGTSLIIGNDPGGSEPFRVGGISRLAGDIYLAHTAVATITTVNNQPLRLGTNNTTRIHISESGEVGIGTTAPGSILHIASPSTLNWRLENTGAGGSTVASYAGVGTGSIGTLTNHAFFVYTNNTERMRFDIAGNVGIGTTSPDTNLSIVKSSGGLPASSGTTPTTAITRIKASANNAMFMGMDVASPYGGWIQVSDITGLGTNYPILLNPNGGNVGIGTTAPAARLDVNGGIAIGSGNVISASANYVQLFRRDGNIGIYLGGVGDPNSYYDNNNHYFRDVNGINTRMIINSAGNVGIGTTSPNTTLQVQGNISASSYTSSISNAVGYFGTSSFAVSASWAPPTPQNTTSGGPLNIYIAQTFGGF